MLEQKYTDEIIEIAEKTLGKKIQDCSEQELNQAFALNIFENDYSAYNQMLEEQNKKDGVISNAFNSLKELTDLGIAKSDVEKAMVEQEEMNKALTDALRGNGLKTFEEVWEKYTGVKYNADKITKYQEAKNIYDFSQIGVQKAQIFTNGIQNAKSTEELYNLYTEYYGDENKAREEISKIIVDSCATSMDFANTKDVRIDENNNVYLINSEGIESNIGSLNNMNISGGYFNAVQNNDFSQKYINKYKEKFEEAMGITYTEITENLYNAKQDAIGNGDKIQNMVQGYCDSQEGFIDKLAGITQTGGLVCTALGAILVTTGIGVTPGGAMMAVGSKVALGSMYGDNVLETMDIMTSKREDKLDAVEKEIEAVLKDRGLYGVGQEITSISMLANSAVVEKAASALNMSVESFVIKQLGNLAEIGTDVALSFASDYILRGGIDVDGEIRSQILAILTGMANAKVASMKAESNTAKYADTDKLTDSTQGKNSNDTNLDPSSKQNTDTTTEANDAAPVTPLKEISTDETDFQIPYRLSSSQQDEFHGTSTQMRIREYLMAQKSGIGKEGLLKMQFPNSNMTENAVQQMYEYYDKLGDEISSLDKSFNNIIPNVLPEKMYRGIGGYDYGTEVIMNAKEGDIIQPDLGYSFWTKSKNYANDYASSDTSETSIVMETTFPIGSKLSKDISFSGIFDYLNPFGKHNVVAPRGIYYEVQGKYTKDGKTHVKLKYLGAEGLGYKIED